MTQSVIADDFASSTEFMRAFIASLPNTSVRGSIDRIKTAARALADEAGTVELQTAVKASLASGVSVSGVLRARELDLISQRDAAVQARRDFESFAIVSRAAAEPALSRAASESIELSAAITALEFKVRRFKSDREQNREMLLEAGLDNDAIARAGLKPSAEDLIAWNLDLAKKRARFSRVQGFLASGPLFDPSLLNVEGVVRG